MTKHTKSPFPMEKNLTHKWGGVHDPHPLRDDPNHPHASLGKDNHVVGFRDGGQIPGDLPTGGLGRPVPFETEPLTFAHGGEVNSRAAAAEGFAASEQQALDNRKATNRKNRLKRQGRRSEINRRKDSLRPGGGESLVSASLRGKSTSISTFVDRSLKRDDLIRADRKREKRARGGASETVQQAARKIGNIDAALDNNTGSFNRDAVKHRDPFHRDAREGLKAANERADRNREKKQGVNQKKGGGKIHKK